MSKIPRTDSISELAEFWESHELVEFADELEEVEDSVFVREDRNVLSIRLGADQAAILHRVAREKGVKDSDLVEAWVAEKLVNL